MASDVEKQAPDIFQPTHATARFAIATRNAKRVAIDQKEAAKEGTNNIEPEVLVAVEAKTAQSRPGDVQHEAVAKAQAQGSGKA